MIGCFLCFPAHAVIKADYYYYSGDARFIVSCTMIVAKMSII